MKFFITGGAGFIGSALVRYLILNTNHTVLNYDKLIYSANLNSLQNVSRSTRYKFIKGDINNKELLEKIFSEYKPDYIMNLAAETHVDKSITTPDDFINTNILGTYNLVNTAYNYWNNLPPTQKKIFRFHHISTDEVFGSASGNSLFTERTPYDPSSPYSSSKASSDHIVRAWNKTYGLPTLLTNCSNNYGPYQYPEKLIPFMINSAINKNILPIYGTGKNIRDWLFVDDHIRALIIVLEKGKIGETYNIGGNCEMTNYQVVSLICELLKKSSHLIHNESYDYHKLIKFVEDRPGHDLRYAIDSSKIKKELGWFPQETFETGLKKTVDWYLGNFNFFN